MIYKATVLVVVFCEFYFHTSVIGTLFSQSKVREKKCQRCRCDSGCTLWNQFKNIEKYNFGEMMEPCWIHHLPDGLVKICISCIINEIQTVGHPASVCYLWTDVIARVLKRPLLLVGSHSLIGGASIISTQVHAQPLWLEDTVKNYFWSEDRARGGDMKNGEKKLSALFYQRFQVLSACFLDNKQ